MPSKTATQILPLENGDRLSRSEFERRYTAMPKLKKAELIEGLNLSSYCPIDYLKMLVRSY